MTSHTSLHTKYRPTKFKEVVGHKDVMKSLKKVVKDGRAHAFVFTGPAGVGKTSIARILANAICKGKATAANLEEIAAANFTGVDSVRKIIEKTNYRAIGGTDTKFFIFDEAHKLSSAAWDALLKAVEEPAKHVYWAFCTTNSGKIPKTIMTRCLQYDLKPLKEEEVETILWKVIEAEGLEIEQDIVEVISESCGGSPRQALVWLEACMYCESTGEARVIMQQAGETAEVVDLARFLLNQRGRDWSKAIKILNELKGMEAESIRIVLCNYYASVLLNTKKREEAFRVLSILDAFSQPYNTSDKMAPLLLSVGQVLFND